MTRNDWTDAGIVVAVCCVFLVLIIGRSARAHDHYTHWKIPGSNSSCCNEKRNENGVVTGDCYATVAEVRNGSWWARRDTGEWIEIPDRSIVRERNPDETGQAAHLCESNGYVFCFRPPVGGS